MKLSKAIKSLIALQIISVASAQSPDSLPATVVQATNTDLSLTQASFSEDSTELAKVPGGTEVFSSERYLTGRASTFADTFFLSPGVIAQSRFGSDEARISIRGSGLQRTFHGRGIRLSQDGIPWNLADGGFDMQSVDPLSISHINIWRGGNALAQGATALGGAIDYRSFTGRSHPGYKLRIEAGSYEFMKAHIAGGITAGSRDLYYSLSQSQQNGYRHHSEQSTQRLNANYWIPDFTKL